MIIECPHCESKVDCDFVCSTIDDYFGEPVHVVLLTCKVCKHPILAYSELAYPSINGENAEWDVPTRLWPFPEVELNPHIPEIVRILLNEARLCFKNHAYIACAVMCGRAIEGICKHYDPKTKNLDSGLKKLLADGLIDKRIYEWGDELRKNRNLGAHASTKQISRDDAEDLLDFTRAICDYVFVLNKRFEDFKTRQLTREKSKSSTG